MYTERLSKLYLKDKAIPLVLLVATIISFGLLIPWLGFYWDDWPVIYITQTQGVSGLWEFYQYDRPFSAWTYVLFSPILGTSALSWHIFTLGLRWLSAVFLWLCLKRIWPKKPNACLWIALLFAVCPLFPQQQVAVAYSQHWLCYLLYFMSIYFMLRAREEKRNLYSFTVLSLLLALVHLFTMEYFVGLELLRPVVLWNYYRVRYPGISWKGILWLSARTASIYALALGFYVTWRLFFLQLPERNVNNPFVLPQLLHEPIQTLISLLERAVQDVLYLLESWIISVNPLEIELRRPFSLAVLGVIIFAFIGSLILLKRYQTTNTAEEDNGWPARAIVFGTFATLLGMLPVWIIGRQVTLGGDRFSFAAMFGVCTIIVGGLEWLSAKNDAKTVVVATLIAIAVHTNLYAAKSYQLSWEKQRDFYWQLFWRAPYIQHDTPFISDGEIFQYVGLYSTSMGISLVYPPVDHPQKIPYWFFNYYEGVNRVPNLETGTTLDYSLRSFSFKGDSSNSLLMSFVPEENKCLQIFSVNDVDIKDIPAPFQRLLDISNVDRIEEAAAGAGWIPPWSIFGAEPKHEWCFYYEKAELARQNEKWAEAIQLFEEAQAQGYSPRDERDYLIFVDAYIRLGELDNALDLTKQVKSISKRNNDSLCGLWARDSELQNSAEYDSFYDEVNLELSCVD